VRRALLAMLMLLVLAAAGCGDDDSEGGDTAGDTAPATSAETEPEPAGDGCREVAQPEPKEAGGERRPRGELERGRKYAVVVQTSCGDFTIAVDPRTAPRTGASFLALARSGFYDGTFFHRIVPGFVIQGGDPTGTGTGGPGYSTRDEPPAGARYTAGVVAMARTPEEPPGTAGSQFFVVTGADTGLPPEYAVLGKVSRGLEVVQRIAALGDPSTEQPTQIVTIEGMRVRGRR
jgi:cyclophilin family peptidyl-prolyl cis-trans isomerase